MADSSITSIEDVNKMKVADLKRELKTRGLNVNGNKTELAERLAAVLETDDHKLDNTMSSEELIDDVLNDDDDEDLDDEIEEDVEAAEKSLIMDTIVDRENELTTLKRKARTDSEPPKVAPKKIVLNRALSVASNPPKEEVAEEKLEDETKPVNAKTEITGPSSDTTEEKKIIKLSSLTAKERLEMRAKKFGAPVSADLRKEARSARFGLNSETSDSKSSSSSIGSAPVKLDLLKRRAERFGISVSPVMSKLDVEERLERRKARFGAGNTSLNKGTAVK